MSSHKGKNKKENKIADSYYPFTSQIAQKLRDANLTAAEWRIWSYLVGIDPWGDRYVDFEVLDVISKCSISTATFYRAIAKFKELQLFDFQDKGFTLKNENGISKIRMKKSSNSQPCETILKNENPESEMRNEFSEMRNDSQDCENQSSKALPDGDHNSPQTSSDPTDNKDSLSQTFSEAHPATHRKEERERTPELKEQEYQSSPGQMGRRKTYLELKAEIQNQGYWTQFINWVEYEIKDFRTPIKEIDSWLAKVLETGEMRLISWLTKFFNQRYVSPAVVQNNKDAQQATSIEEQIEEVESAIAQYKQTIEELKQNPDKASHASSLELGLAKYQKKLRQLKGEPEPEIKVTGIGNLADCEKSIGEQIKDKRKKIRQAEAALEKAIARSDGDPEWIKLLNQQANRSFDRLNREIEELKAEKENGNEN